MWKADAVVLGNINVHFRLKLLQMPLGTVLSSELQPPGPVKGSDQVFDQVNSLAVFQSTNPLFRIIPRLYHVFAFCHPSTVLNNYWYDAALSEICPSGSPKAVNTEMFQILDDAFRSFVRKWHERPTDEAGCSLFAHPWISATSAADLIFSQKWICLKPAMIRSGCFGFYDQMIIRTFTWFSLWRLRRQILILLSWV